MMQAWADYLDKLRRGADVVPIRRGRERIVPSERVSAGSLGLAVLSGPNLGYAHHAGSQEKAGARFWSEISADASSSAGNALLRRTPSILTLTTWLIRFPGPVDSFF